MIKQMISLNPSDRSTFDNLLHISRGTVFPESFYSFLHNYVSSINELSSILTVNMPPTAQPVSTPTTAAMRPGSTIATGTGTNADHGPDNLPSDSDHRMERLWADYESVVPYLIEDTSQDTAMDIRVDYSPSLFKMFCLSSSISRTGTPNFAACRMEAGERHYEVFCSTDP
jgi:phosphoinositide-3-kinase, regulatory subunit 4